MTQVDIISTVDLLRIHDTWFRGMNLNLDKVISVLIEWVKSHPGMTILLIVLIYRMYDHWFYKEPIIRGSRVIQINTKDQFDDLVKNSQFVVVNFTASWCPACRTAWPSFARLSSQLQEVSFVKVNVDVGRELTQGIESIPTFKVYRNGVEVAKFVGYNEQGIREIIGKHPDSGSPRDTHSKTITNAVTESIASPKIENKKIKYTVISQSLKST